MKHIDKVFRDKLYNQKATVPDGMWDKIAPALEEKSGRSVLWFWFAGILALLIGGIAYLLLTDSQEAQSTTSPLAIEQSIEEKQSETNITQPLALAQQNNAIEPVIKQKQITKSVAKSNVSTSTKEVKTTSSTTQATANKNNSSAITTSTKATTTQKAESVNTDNLYGKPANLVITKSYLSDNGAFIEKSDLTKDTEKKQPSYNVFINSEGLNAGTLLRIVEPLENLPLPAFNFQLKKKITL